MQVIRKVGVETGGSNIQFAVNPKDGRMVDHRDEPARVAFVRASVQSDRFSDSEDRRETSGRIYAGRNPNDITRETPASFEPTID